MESIVFGKWHLDCDPQATRQAYALVSLGGPEECGCLHCQNYVVARDHVYPQEIKALFSQLGIDFKKETEVYHIVRLESGNHQYGGWLHFVGAIKSEGDTIGPFDMEQGDDTPFRLFFSNSQNLVPKSFGGLPVVQLEFVAQVPWLLEDPESG